MRLLLWLVGRCTHVQYASGRALRGGVTITFGVLYGLLLVRSLFPALPSRPYFSLTSVETPLCTLPHTHSRLKVSSHSCPMVYLANSQRLFRYQSGSLLQSDAENQSRRAVQRPSLSTSSITWGVFPLQVNIIKSSRCCHPSPPSPLRCTLVQHPLLHRALELANNCPWLCKTAETGEHSLDRLPLFKVIMLSPVKL